MSDSESDSVNPLWEVLDILGQRTANGKTEVLVVWKASWIAKTDLAPGPVLTNWCDTLKTRQDVLLDSNLCLKLDATKRMESKRERTE